MKKKPKRNNKKKPGAEGKNVTTKKMSPKVTKVLLGTTKSFFSDKPQKNNFSLLHKPPGTFAKTKIKAEL